MGYMAKRNPNRISELRLRRRWSQPELADRVGAHWVTISKLERGQMRLTQEWMQRIGDALDVHPTELIADPPTVRTLYIKGNIEGGGRIDRVFDIRDEHIGNNAVPFEVQIGAIEPDRTAWYFVQTEALYPFFHTGDLIRFTYQPVKDFDRCYGRLCLIHLSGSGDEAVVGVPSRGGSPDTFDIQVFGGAPIRHVVVTEAAIVSMAIFSPEFITSDDGYPEP